MKKLTPIAIALFVILSGSPVLVAQDDDSFDQKKAIKQIKADLDKVLQDLSSLSSDKVDPKTGKHAVDQMDELLKNMKNSQGRIVTNIDDLIKNMKMDPSSSPSDQPNDSQQKSQQQKKDKNKQDKRDRNKKPEESKRDQKENQDGKKPKGKKKPGADDQEKKKNKNGKVPQKPEDSGEEKIPVIQDSESWGHLPSEVRQLLIEKNYRDYFPNYGDEISDYLKSLKK